ncbi:MAG: selenocysteine-specific translation elongation factor [Acidobacteriaceae bacterium]|nr:selenocysteine-specific translation elongation factor [Acidobacteriaceae bacterium]
MSDSNMSAHGGIVIGTAGHIDHGKTSLIRALTGIDTDRLVEEKRRGISIDLGFAQLALPNGNRVSFVDVPGHERFIRNMLAGAGGIEAVLLIVAANESVMPQTREHFEICRLLGIERGIIVLTKTDLSSNAQLNACRAEVEQLTAGSFLEHAPMISVSAVTGAGLDILIDRLQDLARAKTSRNSTGLVRLPLDRCFSLKGFGTVLTGTLWNGSLRVGDTVQLQPTGQEARIRGLQVHGEPVQIAVAGSRTAVNLSGVDRSRLQRGFVLTSPKILEPTRLLHASLDWLAGMEQPEPHENLLFHLGTAEVTAHIKVFASEGIRSLIQLNLAEPVMALPADRFVLRRPSPSETVGGGAVIDAFPPRRLSRPKAAARLKRLAKADLAGRLSIFVEEKENGRTVEQLVRLTGQSPDEIKSTITQTSHLLLVEAAQRVVSLAWLKARRELVTEWLEAFHASNPSLTGAPVAQARLGLESVLAHFVFFNFPAIRFEGDLVALVTHRVRVDDRESLALEKIEKAFRSAGYQPANASDTLRSTAIDAASSRSLLEKLIKRGRLVRVSDELVFHADVISHIRNSLAAHKGRRFSVPEFKQWTQISRKYAIPLLEYLDHQRVTRRDGDSRVVL